MVKQVMDWIDGAVWLQEAILIVGAIMLIAYTLREFLSLSSEEDKCVECCGDGFVVSIDGDVDVCPYCDGSGIQPFRR